MKYYLKTINKYKSNILLYSTHLNHASSSPSSSSSFSFSSKNDTKHGTTVLTIKNNNKVTMIADGLMTYGNIRFKTDTIKIKKLTDNIICGFAGSVADCITLMELLETEVEQYPNDLLRSSISFAKTWRTNKSFRRISASLVVSDGSSVLNIDGEGNVIEIKDGVIGIGSGGLFAQCAARALLDNNPDMSNEVICRKAMDIATDLCVFSNKNYIIQEMVKEKKEVIGNYNI